MSTSKFPTVLRRLREERGWTQKDLAEAAGICRQQISLYEWNDVMPRRKNLVKLAKALGCSLDRLMTGRESPKRQGSERQRRFHEVVRMFENGGR